MHPKERDLLNDPPQKVALMYEAVIAMINEGLDINGIKVADITSRAGIGKGTAYEYFSSKDEIITKALLNNMISRTQEMYDLIDGEKTFERKVKALLEYGVIHFHEGRTLFQVLKIALGAYDISDPLKQEFCQTKEETVYRQYLLIQDNLLKAGMEEKILREENVIRQRMAFDSQMISFFLFLSADQNKQTVSMTLEEAKQFTYDGIVKLLG